jgi:hypothetical protein
MRNAVKIIQRTIDVLATSTWVTRLPISQRREITKALNILQAEADALWAQVGEMRSRAEECMPESTRTGEYRLPGFSQRAANVCYPVRGDVCS